MNDVSLKKALLTHIEHILNVETPDALVHLVDASLVRVLQKEASGWEFVTSPAGRQAEVIRHVVDWLIASLANEEPWLRKVDSSGRPKKLMKFGNLEQIAREADKAMLKFAQRAKKAHLSTLDEEHYVDLGGGFSVVKLKSPQALDKESSHMQHCIGAGAYDEYLKHDYCLFLSLRDRSGKPHATIEVRDGVIWQLQGKQNSKPIQRYLEILQPFLVSQKWQFPDVVNYYDHVVDKDGAWHSLHDLPDGLHISSDLIFSFDEADRLPLTRLPKNMTVDGSLFLGGTQVPELPPELKVGKTLSVGGTKITEIPDGTQIGFLLSDSFLLRKIGKNVSIQGDLALSGTAINELGDGLFVGGNLNLTSPKMIELPHDLTVMGSLNARGYVFPNLPKGLKVQGHFALSNALVETIPEDIKVGSLDLRNSRVKALPDGLYVPGVLDLAWTEIESLPARLSVGSGLAIEETPIKSLPEDLDLAGSLSISRENFGQIPLNIISNYRLIVDGRHMTVEQFNDEQLKETKRQSSKVSVTQHALVQR